MVTNRHKSSLIVPNGPKWSQMVPNGPKWFQMVPNGPKCSQKFPNGPKWSELVPNEHRGTHCVFVFLTAIAKGGPWASDCTWQNECTLSEPEPVIGPWVYTEAVYLFKLHKTSKIPVWWNVPIRDKMHWNSCSRFHNYKWTSIRAMWVEKFEILDNFYLDQAEHR